MAQSAFWTLVVLALLCGSCSPMSDLFCLIELSSGQNNPSFFWTLLLPAQDFLLAWSSIPPNSRQKEPSLVWTLLLPAQDFWLVYSGSPSHTGQKEPSVFWTLLLYLFKTFDWFFLVSSSHYGQKLSIQLVDHCTSYGPARLLLYFLNSVISWSWL